MRHTVCWLLKTGKNLAVLNLIATVVEEKMKTCIYFLSLSLLHGIHKSWVSYFPIRFRKREIVLQMKNLSGLVGPSFS